MNSSIYRITLDIHRQTTQVNLAVKKGDTARRIVATLSDGGVPYSIGEGCYAVFMGQKPDGSVLYNACSIENGQIVYDFTEQTVSAAGRMVCELRLYGSDEQLITSPRIAIIVSGTVYEDSEVESSAEFTALSKAMTDLEKLKEEELQRAFVVTVANTEDGYRADKSLQEIRRAAEQGRYCLCNLEEFLIPLVMMESSAHFAGVWHGREYRVEIAADDVTVEVTELGDGGVFTVTYTDNEDEYQRIDKTFAEIRAAIDSGMVVQCYYDFCAELLPLVYDGGTGLQFARMGLSEYREIYIKQDGSATLTNRLEIATTQVIRMFAYADGTVDIDFPEELRYIMYYGGTLPAVLLTGADIMGDIWLPFVQAYSPEGTTDSFFVFSKDIPVDGKAKRYTIKLNDFYLPGESEPYWNAELLVEELVGNNGIGEYTLPIATPETLGGVQPVAKSADMTQSVGVDATGRLWTEPSGEGGGSGEVVLIDYTAEEPVSMVEIPVTEEMKTAIANANCIRWRLTLSGDETATDTTGYGSAELMFWCGWNAGKLLPTTAECVPSAENKSWAVGNISGYIFKSSAISNLGIESSTGVKPNTVDLYLSCICKATTATPPPPSFNTTLIRLPSADMVLRLTTSLPIGTGSRIILTVS